MGTNLMIILFASLVCIGQGVLTYGVADKNFSYMLVGRFIFGFGAECLDVGQSDIVTKWFRGHGMAFAFGLNFTVARLFTTFSDNFSSRFADSSGINFSMKVGLVTCVGGIVSALLISQLYRLAPVLSIPDLISAVGSPLCGVLVDYYGHRSYIIVVSGICFLAAHFILAFSSYSPLLGMSIIGVGYSLFASTLWAFIPVFVSDEQVGTAFGIISSGLNIGLFVFPIIVGWIRSSSGESNFLPTQYFFMVLCFIALVASLFLIPYETNALDQSKLNLLNPSLITENDQVEEYVITSLGRAPTRVLVKVGDKLKARKTAHVARIQSNTDLKVILQEQGKNAADPNPPHSVDGSRGNSMSGKFKTSKSKGSLKSVDTDQSNSIVQSHPVQSPNLHKQASSVIPEDQEVQFPSTQIASEQMPTHPEKCFSFVESYPQKNIDEISKAPVKLASKENTSETQKRHPDKKETKRGPSMASNKSINKSSEGLKE
ncbi:hypothetical protein HDV01_007328 [Terramyces sp. JEL0728]|nr:hypothetical protein HDV01_007328 [Terramyces sp. JEL0728]